MVEHQLPLFFERRVGRNRPAAQRRVDLLKQPRLDERRPGDHHAIDRVAAKRFDHRRRRSEVAVADQRNPLQVRLDLGNAIPVGRALEKVLGRAAVNGQGRGPGRFDHLGHFDGVDRVARAARAGSWP